MRLYCRHHIHRKITIRRSLIVRNVMSIYQLCKDFIRLCIILKSKILVDNLLHKTKIVPDLLFFSSFQAFDLWYQSKPFELRLYCRHHIYRKITIRRCLSIMSRCIYHNWPILGHKFGLAQCFGQRSGKLEKVLKGSLDWSNHPNLQWKFKLLAIKFAWDVKAKNCWALSTNFLFSEVCWQPPAMLYLYTSSKLSRP